MAQTSSRKLEVHCDGGAHPSRRRTPDFEVVSPPPPSFSAVITNCYCAPAVAFPHAEPTDGCFLSDRTVPSLPQLEAMRLRKPPIASVRAASQSDPGAGIISARLPAPSCECQRGEAALELQIKTADHNGVVTCLVHHSRQQQTSLLSPAVHSITAPCDKPLRAGPCHTSADVRRLT